MSKVPPKNLFLKRDHFKRKLNTEDGEEHLNLINFSLGQETYGLELTSLKEILKVNSITRVPRSRDYLKGIINLRGSIITVVDLKKLLGFQDNEITKQSRILIIRNENRRHIGLLVDRVEKSMRLDRKQISEPPLNLPEEKRKFIYKLGKTEEKIITLLNLKPIYNLANQ